MGPLRLLGPPVAPEPFDSPTDLRADGRTSSRSPSPASRSYALAVGLLAAGLALLALVICLASPDPPCEMNYVRFYDPAIACEVAAAIFLALSLVGCAMARLDGRHPVAAVTHLDAGRRRRRLPGLCGGVPRRAYLDLLDLLTARTPPLSGGPVTAN